MKTKWLWLMAIWGVMTVGCAQVQVQAPKDPIKMDISMRLDIYQHVAKDADDIEDLVEGAKSIALGGFWVGTAYADEDGLGAEAMDAAYRRKARREALLGYQTRGMLGESDAALVAARRNPDATATDLMNAENKDRMIIYRSIAQKRGSSVQDVQKVYAERIQKNLPAGVPVQSADGRWSDA